MPWGCRERVGGAIKTAAYARPLDPWAWPTKVNRPRLTSHPPAGSPTACLPLRVNSHISIPSFDTPTTVTPANKAGEGSWHCGYSDRIGSTGSVSNPKQHPKAKECSCWKPRRVFLFALNSCGFRCGFNVTWSNIFWISAATPSDQQC